jgi:competence protein ComEC
MIPSSENGKLEIAFLDVGQGDCIFIQTSRERILIDTGPRSEQYDAGERIIMPYLMERRVGSLDMVIITHEDLDHIGGANYLLTNIPTAAVAVPEVGDRLLNAGWQEGIPSEYLFHREKLVKLRAGDCLSYPSGLRLEVLAPISAVGGTEADANNNSFVCILTFLEWKILLTGDMEMEEMNQIQERGVEWDADFIKIPHHGSKGSLDPDWFDKTDPRAVFISVGRNRFGHPAPEVLAYWEERAVPVFRTDVHGTIGLYLDADGFEIKTGR